MTINIRIRNAGIAGGIIWLLLILSLASGYVMNLYSIFHTADGPLTGKFILRIIGIFAFPLGGILGWF